MTEQMRFNARSEWATVKESLTIQFSTRCVEDCRFKVVEATTEECPVVDEYREYGA